MTEQTDEVLAAAVKRQLGVILWILQDDPHQWSTRPCPTCETISQLAGLSFGCVRKREAENAQRADA